MGGNDVVLGKGGNDVLRGGPGQDLLQGQGGSDELLGETGKDVVVGGAGDDDLNGGPQADDLDGGAGDNTCTVGASDEASRCRYDRTAPVASAPTWSADVVDVTAGPRTVTVQVRVTDDVGVQYVTIRPGADTPWYPLGYGELTSGTRRDGTWTATITLDRWARPGIYRPRVQMYDHVDHHETTAFEGGFEVRNTAPDVTAPQVSVVSPTPTTTYDVRTDHASVVVRVRITDAGSGVDPEGTFVTLWAPRSNGQQTTGLVFRLRLESGTRRNGIWRADAYVRQGSVGGTYNFSVLTGDLSMRDTQARVIYWSQAEYVYAYDDGYWEPRLLPDGMGTIEVVGRPRNDSTPPALSGVAVSPSTVDTLTSAAQVHVSADAVDVGRGVGGISVALRPTGDLRWEAARYSVMLSLDSGTIKDGTWRGTISLPRGATPGTYVLEVFAWDRDQNEVYYVSSSNPRGSGSQLLDTDPIVTVVDSEP